MNYKITIEENIAEDFTVEASSLEEARAIAEANYRSGKFVLENPALTQKRMAVSLHDENVLDFTDF